MNPGALGEHEGVGVFVLRRAARRVGLLHGEQEQAPIAHVVKLGLFGAERGLGPGDGGVAGTAGGEDVVQLDERAPLEIPLPANLDNMSLESLLVTPSGLLTFFEANGAKVNSRGSGI